MVEVIPADVWVLVALATMLGTGIFLLNQWTNRLSPQDSIVDRVNALLPQIQCAQCGYPGCRPYAQAIVEEKVPIDLCPPGGETTAQQLAALLDRPLQIPVEPTLLNKVASIDERECVGCALCIQACPVDAIVGALQYMHTVCEDLCTSCELCVPVCPVDCIAMVEEKEHA